MPKIKVEKVISFSSEDPVHVASNILSNDPAKKWKCHLPGEKAANLVLQLEEAAVISNIDIGNEHSAYVEVLVGRSCSNDDFKVLLVMSSFMSPLESRQSINVNKVRMFTREQLSVPERDEKWDRVKIVCTQPFNRHIQYGLSFITFHTTEKANEKIQTPHIGKFALRPESPNNIAIGSLFARKQELQENKPLTAAAAIRHASLSQESPTSKKIKLPLGVSSAGSYDETLTCVSRRRDEIFYTKDEDGPDEKIDFVIEQKKLEKEKLKNKDTTPTKAAVEKVIEPTIKKEKNKINAVNGLASTSKDRGESTKRKIDKKNIAPNKRAKQQLRRPFHQLFSDVVLVISGIQNPERANIRTMAIAMGGKYKADWDSNCTHLVCAFANTPKFNQVKGKGKIVTRKWVTDCHSQRKRIPWRRYALDKNDKDKNESEEEIVEEAGEDEIVEEVNDAAEALNGDDDNRDIKSGSDTEDEIERINTLQQLKHTERKQADLKNNGQHSDNETSPVKDVFDCDTEEEDIGSETVADCPPLPNLFQDKLFYVDHNLGDDERKILQRYIIACNGTVNPSTENCVDYIVTSKEHKWEYDEASPRAVLIHPNFVYECFNSKKLLPHAPFVL